jgi:hypothetical protein
LDLIDELLQQYYSGRSCSILAMRALEGIYIKHVEVDEARMCLLYNRRRAESDHRAADQAVAKVLHRVFCKLADAKPGRRAKKEQPA